MLAPAWLNTNTPAILTQANVEARACGEPRIARVTESARAPERAYLSPDTHATQYHVNSGEVKVGGKGRKIVRGMWSENRRGMYANHSVGSFGPT